MQITNTISGNLFNSYKTNKKEASEETQIVSLFVDIESQKIDEAELVMRSKTDALQSQVEQMKKNILRGAMISLIGLNSSRKNHLMN